MKPSLCWSSRDASEHIAHLCVHCPGCWAEFPKTTQLTAARCPIASANKLFWNPNPTHGTVLGFLQVEPRGKKTFILPSRSSLTYWEDKIIKENMIGGGVLWEGKQGICHKRPSVEELALPLTSPVTSRSHIFLLGLSFLVSQGTTVISISHSCCDTHTKCLGKWFANCEVISPR